MKRNPLALGLNLTTLLILPLVLYDYGITGEKLLSRFDFIEAYLGDVDNPSNDDHIIAVFKREQIKYDIPYCFEEDKWAIIKNDFDNISDECMRIAQKFWAYPIRRYDLKTIGFSIFVEVKDMGVE